MLTVIECDIFTRKTVAGYLIWKNIDKVAEVSTGVKVRNRSSIINLNRPDSETKIDAVFRTYPKIWEYGNFTVRQSYTYFVARKPALSENYLHFLYFFIKKGRYSQTIFLIIELWSSISTFLMKKKIKWIIFW